MPRRTVDQLRDGDPIDDVYLVAEKQLRVNRNGAPYLQLDLRDRTGGISARSTFPGSCRSTPVRMTCSAPWNSCTLPSA